MEEHRHEPQGQNDFCRDYRTIENDRHDVEGRD